MPSTAITLANSIRTNLQASEAQLSPERILDLINQAIDFAAVDNLYRRVTDETLDQTDSTYEYNLTGSTNLTNLKYIYEIREEDAHTAGLFMRLIPKSYWRLVEGSSYPQLVFFDSTDWQPSSSLGIQITGGVRQPRITDPDDTIYLPEAYVIWKATMFGHMALAAGGGPRAQWHERSVPIAAQQAEIARIGSNEYRLSPVHFLVPGR